MDFKTQCSIFVYLRCENSKQSQINASRNYENAITTHTAGSLQTCSKSAEKMRPAPGFGVGSRLSHAESATEPQKVPAQTITKILQKSTSNFRKSENENSG